MKKAVVASIASVVLACASFAAIAQAPKPHDVEDFIRKPKFNNIQISPTGEYYAATVSVDRKTALVIIRRSDNKLMATMGIPGDRTHVEDFAWVNDERVLLTPSMKLGALERPQYTGELFAVNADGSRAEMLVGFRLQDQGTGSMVKQKKAEAVAASMIDSLRSDDKEVLISVRPFGPDQFTRVEKLDTYTGQRIPVTRVPVRNAGFLTDNAGVVRFARGQNTDLTTELYYRASDKDPWKQVGAVKDGSPTEAPLAFSADNKVVYMQVQHETGPDSVVAWDIAADTRKEVFRDASTDPRPIYLNGEIHGVQVLNGVPRRMFFDDQSSIAKLYRKLEKAFAGQAVSVTSMTRDGKLALVTVWGDKNPGDYYVFDTTTNKADYLLSLNDWIDPAALAATKPVSFKARDGLDIHGFLTSPVGAQAGKSPLIVLIHGGPFGVFDLWGYDQEVQMLAAHGYAVLQVNFRGSGNHGFAFEAAGKRQWGGRMQDDITDATKWAIDQGIADASKICLYGGSYGGYASLMGVVKEPDMYRCAAGTVGVYDLPTLHVDGDIPDSRSGKNFVFEWIGPKEELAAVSPNRMANRIKVPVFLSAGGEDDRAPIKHTRMMEKALRAANVPVEAVYYPTEGHGFYKIENARDYYGKLLTFFQRHLGGRAPVIKASEKK